MSTVCRLPYLPKMPPPKMWRLFHLLLCGLLLASRAGAQEPDAPAAPGSPGASVRAPAAGRGAPIRVTFLDVGQGDAVLIRTPADRAVLVDAGPGSWTPPGVRSGTSSSGGHEDRSPGSRAGGSGGRSLVPRLRALGVDTLSLLVASHAHADHIGGMEAVLRSIPVKAFMDNGIPYTTRTYLELMRTLRDRPDVRYLRPVARTIRLGEAELRVLPPPDGVDDQNDGSVGLVLAYGAFRALLTGDSERDELSHWLAEGEVPEVTLLKAPHHGSANGFTPAFLRAAAPEVVVISVGENPYGHPMPRALAAYGRVARRVYRTDRDGDVTVLGWRDGRWKVRTKRDRGDPGSAGPHRTVPPAPGSGYGRERP